jgi:uncharacterized protein (DUF362 family)
MSVIHHKFGQTTIARVRDYHELRLMLVDPWLKSETLIIKPNWVTNEPADFTDSDALRTLFEALDSHIIVTESFNIARSLNLLKSGMRFIAGDKEANWRWLLKGAGWDWIIENPEWDWFKVGEHWKQIKKEDKAFLDENGFTDLFREFNIDYVNVTDEVWSGRTADPTTIKRAVESRFKPVRAEKLYGMVPKKLYDLRGSTLISFSKLKCYATFTMKNLFGMIPDPHRAWWHGPNNSRIAGSIIDINKIYRSLFNVYGLFEALNSTAVPHNNGKFEGIYSGKYNIVDGLGVVAFGRDLVSLDAILCNLAGRSMLVETIKQTLDLAEEEFGVYDRAILEDSKIRVGNWLSTNDNSHAR